MTGTTTDTHPTPAPVEVPTSDGSAHVRVLSGGGPARGTLLLGHGAGGRRDAADVLALTDLTRDGWTVALVDQPWRVAGRRVAGPPAGLDRAWSEVLTHLSEGSAPEAAAASPLLPRPWVYGGRSAGARVACRTSAPGSAAVEGVAAVLCLAFPLHPPGRPERSRAEELALPLQAGLPVLVVNGTRDPMGSPEEIRDAVGPHDGLSLHAVPGTHSPSTHLEDVLAHARSFLATVTSPRPDHRSPTA
ncbi:alpha/beta hydrolase family protein [Serinicoccus sp. LYQ131]|uniref:alpha/beta hydrolase family protein n=1 Tax=Serinicoccus sp. LYQ131 TaxID=3378797 RepID=UPI0038544A25